MTTLSGGRSISSNTQPPEGGWTAAIGKKLNDEFQHTAAWRRLPLYRYLTPKYDGFNTQPPEGGWDCRKHCVQRSAEFQHTAAWRRLDDWRFNQRHQIAFQHTAAWRRLVSYDGVLAFFDRVSTHSRPKAAGLGHVANVHDSRSFNTQPPEGGWGHRSYTISGRSVSTHSRLKAAGYCLLLCANHLNCFNTQPPEGGWKTCWTLFENRRSFNTQPPEGGWITLYILNMGLY